MSNIDDFLDKYSGEHKDFQPEEIQVQLSAKTQQFAQELIVKSREAERIKDRLTELNKRIWELSSRILPELFNEQHIITHTTDEGIELNLSPYYKASLPKEMDPQKKEEALVYLREHAPEIVKTEYTLSYGAQEREVADIVLETLHTLGFEPEIKEAVHHATLTAWVKEQFLNGVAVPFERLNATVGSVVNISKTKEQEAQILAKLRKLKSPTGGASPGEA